MRSRRIRLLVTFLTIVATFPFVVGAGGGVSDDARSEHQRIVEFWTPERVAQAIPRHFVFDLATGTFRPAVKPDNPGNGNGGGKPGGGGDGGGSDVVTGDPWNGGGEIDGSIGKVLFAMDGTYYVCSATVIDDGDADAFGGAGSGSNDYALILTAAHCVYDEANGAFATNWMFIPDYDAAPAGLTTSGSFCTDTAYGCWTAESMAVHDGYAGAGGFNDTAVLYDFGVVRVKLGGHGADDVLDDVVADQGYSFETLTFGDRGYAFGYPAAKKYKGSDLIYCAGPVDGDPYNDNKTYRLNECKMTGGSSGGGWLSPFDEGTGAGTLVSLNSYGYTGVNAMHGPFLNSNTQAVYNAAADGGFDIVP